MGNTAWALGKCVASILHDTGVRGYVSYFTHTRGEVAVPTTLTHILVAADVAWHSTWAREEDAPLVKHRLLQ
jgi:hypothetical protein